MDGRLSLLGFGLWLSACAAMPSPPVTDIHATVIYRINATLGKATTPEVLTAVLPGIKSIGFNAVFVPAIWADFDPKPLASPRIYSSASFTAARASLEILRLQHMRALVGLDYIGQGFSPDLGPVQPCDWATNQQSYAAFEQYVEHFLTELVAYSDVLVPFVFTEGAEGCGQNDAAHGPAVAAALRSTLGSLPTRLPPALRDHYQLGYHDYSLINLGWANGASPLASPNPFDWLSMVAYNVGNSTELEARLGRFRALYPATPMLIGEIGTSACSPSTPAIQASQDGLAVKFALQHGLGFSVWGWLNHGKDECGLYGGMGITELGGTPNSAALVIKNLLGN